MGTIGLKLLMGVALALVGCRTVAPEDPRHATGSVFNQGGVKGLASSRASARSPATPVLAETRLPDAFPATLAEPPTRHLRVPPGMLAVSEVVRPRAEVRGGPGARFEVADKVLPLGARVLVFDGLGVWRKVVAMADGQTGWVHAQALAPPRPSAVAMRVDTQRLPIVLAMRDVEAVQSFPAETPLKARIPRGTMFRSLMYADGSTLVWLPETASVMWLSRKDVR